MDVLERKGVCCMDFVGKPKGRFAGWISGGFARWVSERAGERSAEWLSRESKRDPLHGCLERAREGFARDEGVWWLLSHVLCARDIRSFLKKHLVQSVYN